MVIRKTNNNTSQDDILDSFLTTIESKLRGPFSSMDLAKGVGTAALRQSSQFGSTAPQTANDPAQEYLDHLSSVFGRTNKVIQCRMLIGLLGLNDMRTNNKNNFSTSSTDNKQDSDEYLTPEILRILHETQEESHEEWVRTTSGLVEGVMFRTKDGSERGNTRESCRSQEATKIIRDTGTEVCEKVERQIQKAGRPHEAQSKQKESTRSTLKAEQPANGFQDKRNTTTSAAAANKRNRGFIIEKVKASSSQPSIKKEEQTQQPPIKEEPKPTVVERTEPIPPDLNACFAPYRYRLIPTSVLNTIIPEFELSKEKSKGNDSNCHFQVNAAADILQVDLKLEAQRAKEHGSNVATKSKNPNDGRTSKNPSAASNGGSNAFPPGFRPTKIVRTSGGAASKLGATSKLGAAKAGARTAGGKSSLFMPKKKGASNLFNTTTKFRPQPSKTMLKRKGGGVQALLKSGATASGGGAILNKLGSGSASTGAARARPGGVGRFSANRDASRGGAARAGRMKMIGDDDVDTLTKLQQSTAKSNMTAAELRASKRKRILEKAAQRGIHGSGGGAVSSFGNQQRKKQKVSLNAARAGKPEEPAVKAASAAAAAPAESQQSQDSYEEWQTLLRDRSNKMSADDRLRVQKFFTTTNAAQRSALLLPSEGGPVYKMKIHEQRGVDPGTGQEIKETFYLELDYNTGDSKQSKKVKRY